FLSDDYYAGFTPFAWRGRGLFLPEYALSRLVETPTEILAIIDTFLADPNLTATTGLVTGYDFLSDQAQGIDAQLTAAGMTVTSLINDHWTAAELENLWLNNRHDLNAINAHFGHFEAIPAETSGGVVTPAEVAATPIDQAGSLVFSVGCHSGFSAPDHQATANGLDFPQALLGRGVTYIANTGYGYGDADTVGYSELLMTLFVEQLCQSSNIGQALRQAKLAYFNRISLHSLSPYDEKVLAEATLYGLPMYGVELPICPNMTDVASSSNGRSLLVSITDDLATRKVVFTPTFTAHAVANGKYFSVLGETESNPGQPIQPRTSLDVSHPGTVARGAVFEGGRYQTFDSFDPVVTRVITEDSDLPLWQAEPPFAFDRWVPASWSLINSIRTADGLQQRLVVMPAHYRALDEQIGIERLFDEMTYTVYYANSEDRTPPSIWAVRNLPGIGEFTIEVEATDFAGVRRVVVAYNTGDGIWLTVDMTQSPNDEDFWTTTLPLKPTVEYFVQVVDEVGNVAVSNNKGRYFVTPYTYYFPVFFLGR
ncbi:MAG: hypothetical protein DWQ04_04815, partial [Chloroflexi bacterium]